MEEYVFDDFLVQVSQDYKTVAAQIHEKLIQDGYKSKIELKANGFFVSYSHPKTKRSLLNFVFRKNRLIVRIYADNHKKYEDFMENLPEKMVNEIAKSSVCKRLINPFDCNSRCVMGYDFIIKDNHYQKCRYSCFQFEVNGDSVPFITEFIEREIKERQV